MLAGVNCCSDLCELFFCLLIFRFQVVFVNYIASVLAPLCLLDFGGERWMMRSTLMMFVLSPGGMFSHLYITGNAREGDALGDLGASRKHRRPISALS